MNNKKMMVGLLTAGLLLVPNAALAESTDVNLIVNDTHVVSSEAEGQVYISRRHSGCDTADRQHRLHS